MTHPTADRDEKLLNNLIALQTLNLMGRPYTGSLPIERPVMESLERLFAPNAGAMRRRPVFQFLLTVLRVPSALAAEN